MELTNKISNWLEKQGYPLEMFVSQKFKEQNFSVSQSLYYYDYEIEKSREIDILAHESVLAEDSFVSIDFIIECKSSKNPWLLFTAKKSYKYDPMFESDQFLYNKSAFPIMLELGATDLIKKLSPFYYKFSNIGYGLTQAFSNGNDIAYKAINTLAKYSVFSLKESDEKRYVDCKIIIPILAIDTPLFEVSLSNDYKMKIESKEIGFISLKNLISEYEQIPIIVITKQFLDKFSKSAKLSTNWLMNYCKKNLKSIQTEYQKIEDEYNLGN